MKKKAVLQPQYFEVENDDNMIYTSELVIGDGQQKLTPMKAQYLELKVQFPDDIMLFHRGSFYLAYFDDAHLIRDVLGCQWKEYNVNIGLHENSLRENILKLLQTGKRIVVCQQMANTHTWEGNVLPREVVGIYSKGLIGFGILTVEDDIDKLDVKMGIIDGDEALLIDSIGKMAYYMRKEDIASYHINEYITTYGENLYEKLFNFFRQRRINGIQQLTFYDHQYQNITNKVNPQKYCYLSEITFRQLYTFNLKCASRDGQRTLEQMLRRPLIDFKDQQRAITELANIPIYCDSFQQSITGASMMNRLGSLYNCTQQIKLRQFIEDIKQIVFQLNQKIKIHTFQSTLFQFKTINESLIRDFETMIIWEGENYNIATPNTKMRNEYITISDKLESIQRQASDEFNQIKLKFECNVTFNDQKFEFEVPDGFEQQGYILTAKRKGFKRYKSVMLESLEQQTTQIKAIRAHFLEQFWKYILNELLNLKDTFIEIIAQMSLLDALICLSRLEGCIPQIGQFELIDFRHPFIKDCVQNSLCNDRIILTGYNGAGKSTILRAVGMLVILAQNGARVPCSKMSFTPYQSIYCRMGASDSLRRSTFEIELIEVKDMFDHQNSLLLIDELGRGTSSIDGHSIAYAVLKYLLKQQSSILFTTHFDIDLCQNYYMEKYVLREGKVINNLTKYLLN